MSLLLKLMSFPLPHLETVFDAIGDSKLVMNSLTIENC